MHKPDSQAFEKAMLPHLDAAHALARWLVRGGEDAEDRVQDAYLRAWKAFADFRGGDAKAWLLTIVRNACYTWLKAHRTDQLHTAFDEETHAGEAQEAADGMTRNRERAALRKAVEALPVEFREVIVLREWEGFSYREISEIADIPMGTVMSRLVRARERLHKALTTAPEGGR